MAGGQIQTADHSRQVRRDIDGIIVKSLNFTTFLDELRKVGYQVCSGNRKYTAVKPPYGKKFIRLDSLGENYTDSAIEQRILSQRSWNRPKQLPVQRHYTCKGSFKKHPKVHGFRALYFHYVYLLRGAANGRGSQKVSRYLLEDTIQFRKYLAQHRFLAEHRIETTEELQFTNNRLTAQLDTAVRERKSTLRRKEAR